MLGWSVAVTAEDGADAQLELLHRSGASTVHCPMPVVERDGSLSAGRLVTLVAERSLDAVTFTSSNDVGTFVRSALLDGRLDEVQVALGSSVLTVSIGPACTAAIVDAGLAVPLEPAVERLDTMVLTLAGHAAERRRSVRVGEVELLLDATHPVVGGTVVEMAARERAVLEVLARRPGAVVSKAAIGRSVWGRSSGLHAVEVTVGRLRERLAPGCAHLLRVETVARRGYRLVGSTNRAVAPRTGRPAVPESP